MMVDWVLARRLVAGLVVAAAAGCGQSDPVADEPSETDAPSELVASNDEPAGSVPVTVGGDVAVEPAGSASAGGAGSPLPTSGINLLQVDDPDALCLNLEPYVAAFLQVPATEFVALDGKCQFDGGGRSMKLNMQSRNYFASEGGYPGFLEAAYRMVLAPEEMSAGVTPVSGELVCGNPYYGYGNSGSMTVAFDVNLAAGWLQAGVSDLYGDDFDALSADFIALVGSLVCGGANDLPADSPFTVDPCAEPPLSPEFASAILDKAGLGADDRIVVSLQRNASYFPIAVCRSGVVEQFGGVSVDFTGQVDDVVLADSVETACALVEANLPPFCG